jgi:pimeloyl-ACP methyl ester carboxylesterase
MARCPPLEDSPAAANKTAISLTRWGDVGPRMVVILGGVQGHLGGGHSTFLNTNPIQGQMILPERLGFGQSPSRSEDDTENDSIWISDMLDGVALFEQSFGGAEAPLSVARRPDGVRTFVLVEPAFARFFPRSDILAAHDDARRAY